MSKEEEEAKVEYKNNKTAPLHNAYLITAEIWPHRDQDKEIEASFAWKLPPFPRNGGGQASY